MMQCPNCKHVIPGNAVFCPYCQTYLGDTDLESGDGADQASNAWSDGSEAGTNWQNSNRYDNRNTNKEPQNQWQQSQKAEGWEGRNGGQSAYENGNSGTPERTPRRNTIAQEAVRQSEAEEDRKKLIRTIITVSAAALIVVVIFVALFLTLHKSGSKGLTAEEAQELVEDTYSCYADQAAEYNNSVIFNCYSEYNKQTGQYSGEMGTVQVNLETGAMNVVSGMTGEIPSVSEAPEPDPQQTQMPDGEAIPTGDAPVGTLEPEKAPSISAPVASAKPASNNTTVIGTKYVVNCDYGLYVWKDTKCSDKYCIILLGDEVGYIEDAQGTNYSKVSYNGYIGYVNKNYLSNSKPSIDNSVRYKMYVTSDNVSFRNGPSTSYGVISTLSQNTEVGYIRDMVDNPSFAKVSYNGTIGYVAKKYLSTSKINNTVSSYKYIDNVDYAVCLWKTTAAEEYYCIIELGEKVGFIENVSGTNYAKVKYGSQTGYVNKSYLSDSKPYINTTVASTKYANTENTPLLLAPGGAVGKYLPSGTAVGYIMNLKDHYLYAKVKYDNNIYYVLSQYLSDSAPAPSIEPAPPSAEPAPPSAEPAPPSEEPAPPSEEPAPPSEEPAPTPGRITDSGVSASSSADGYASGNAADYDESTAWVAGSEGSAEYITLSISSGTTITGICIATGMCSSEEDFYAYGAPSEIEISTGGQSVTLSLSGIADSYQSSKDGCSYDLGTSLVSDGSVRITVISVRSGSTSNAAAISEVYFNGY